MSYVLGWEESELAQMMKGSLRAITEDNEKMVFRYGYEMTQMMDFEDEYDETDYSFSMNQDYNQTIPTNLTSFIDSNDIFHLDGYAKLTYDYPLYGEEDDGCTD